LCVWKIIFIMDTFYAWFPGQMIESSQKIDFQRIILPWNFFNLSDIEICCRRVLLKTNIRLKTNVWYRFIETGDNRRLTAARAPAIPRPRSETRSAGPLTLLLASAGLCLLLVKDSGTLASSRPFKWETTTLLQKYRSKFTTATTRCQPLTQQLLKIPGLRETDTSRRNIPVKSKKIKRVQVRF